MKLADVLQIVLGLINGSWRKGYVMNSFFGGRREIAQLHVVNHSLTKCRHGMLL